MVHPGYEGCIAYGTPWYMRVYHLGMYTLVYAGYTPPGYVHICTTLGTPLILYPTLVYPVMMYTTLGVREEGPGLKEEINNSGKPLLASQDPKSVNSGIPSCAGSSALRGKKGMKDWIDTG